MDEWASLSRDEIVMGFVASCVEDAAERVGQSYREMFERMERVGLIDNFIYRFYDTLHTESRAHATDEVLEALAAWEAFDE